MRQVQALVRLAFVSADSSIAIQHQHVDRHLEQLPQLIALRVIEQRIAFVLEHKNRAARFDTAQAGVGKLLKRSSQSHGVPERRCRRRGPDGRVERMPDAGMEQPEHCN